MFDARWMRLIHVRIHTPADFVAFDLISSVFWSCAAHGEQVEHVSVHPTTTGILTVGFYVVTETVPAAERLARSVAERALRGDDRFRGCRVISCSAALVGEYFDWLLEGADGRFMRLPHEDTERS